MWRHLLMMAAAFSTVALASVDSISKVNGSVRVEPGRTVGDVSTVNGSIDLGEGARARDVETVNGSVRLQARVVAESVETVNGSVRAGTDVQVVEKAETVNGRITLEPGTRVGGDLETVNGDLVLGKSTVDGQLRTVNGDIRVGADSRVRGGILVEKSRGWNQGQRVPKVVIGPRAVVEGRLRFEREVDLYVSESATIGPVEGATAVRFRGDEP